MAQNTQIERSVPRYTRADFAALRAWLNKLPLARIAALDVVSHGLRTSYFLRLPPPGAKHEGTADVIRSRLPIDPPNDSRPENPKDHPKGPPIP